MYEIKTGEWLGEFAVEAGANLLRLLHLPTGIEVLRTPKKFEDYRRRPELYGIPVLFPPNRIDAGVFVWGGREYAFPINETARHNHLHGLALGRPWRMTAATGETISFAFDYAATPGFPHDFTLALTYRFAPDGVRQDFSVCNRSSLPMPFGAGFHTAFRVLPDSTVSVTAADGYWEILKRKCLPTGRLISWDGDAPVFRDTDDVSLHCPATTGWRGGKPFRGAVIAHPSHGAEVVYEVDEKYPHWCLWNSFGGEGFFCAEPMSWMVNAPNLALSPEITGMQALAPAQTWRAVTSLRVEKIGTNLFPPVVAAAAVR